MPGFAMHRDAFLPIGERPWPHGWESDPRIDDGHEHAWEWVVARYADGRGEVRGVDGLTYDFVIRCRVCHAPRCGHREDRDPCMERRHHAGMHYFYSGAVGLLGGIMR